MVYDEVIVFHNSYEVKGLGAWGDSFFGFEVIILQGDIGIYVAEFPPGTVYVTRPKISV